MNYYNPKIKRLITSTVLHGMMGGDPGIDVIRRAGWFPVRYDYLNFNADTHRMLPMDDLVFDSVMQEYVQRFRLEELSAEEKAERMERRQKEAAEKAAEKQRVPDLEDAVAELGVYVDESATETGDAVIDLAGYVAELEERIAALEGAKE